MPQTLIFSEIYLLQPLIFQPMASVGANNNIKDIGNSKFEFMSKTQFLLKFNFNVNFYENRNIFEKR